MKFFVIFYSSINGFLLLIFKYVGVHLVIGITQRVQGGLRLVSVRKKPLSIQHRSRWDIMANVLSAATGGKTKTCIMRRCNLSYRQLQAYLNVLCERGLLNVRSPEEKGNPGKIFATSDKGRTFLKAYGNLRTTIERKY